MAATLTQVNPRWVGNTSGKACMARRKVIADEDVTWKAGQFLRIDSSGLIEPAVTGASSKYDYQLQALADLNTVTGDETGAVLQEVAVIDPGDVFEINELNGAVSRANVGQQYNLDVTNNICTVDVDTGTYPTLEVVDANFLQRPYGPEALSDINGRLLVKVLLTCLQSARSAE